MPDTDAGETTEAAEAAQVLPARALLDTAVGLLRAYPSRPTRLDPEAEPSRLCRELRALAAPAASQLSPGDDWLGDASVGQANWAAAPWVAFFDRRVTSSTQRGVYPVLDLFWKSWRGLRLGLNVSVTEIEQLDRDPGAVREELAQADREALEARGFKPGAQVRAASDCRLPHSYARWMVFEKRIELDAVAGHEAEIVEDLRALLCAYRRWVDHAVSERKVLVADDYAPVTSLPEAAGVLASAARRRGLVYPRELLEALLLSLKSKPFCLLAGATGTGKSRLGRLLADAGVVVRVEAVDPAWGSGESLLGRWEGEHFRPGELAEHAARAVRNPDRYHVLLLDELNLARVEHYMAHWLSVVESRRIESGRVVADPLLRQDGESVTLPENFGVIGTVNLDASNPALPQAVLDRVNVLLLRSPTRLLETPGAATGGNGDEDEVRTIHPAVFATRALAWPEIQEAVAAGGWSSSFERAFRELLQPTQDVLARHASHVRISYRLRDEMGAYLLHGLAAGLAQEGLEPLLDQQLRQRLLPRLCCGVRLPPDLVQDLSAIWSGLGEDPHGAAGLLQQVARLQASTRRPASLWEVMA